MEYLPTLGLCFITLGVNVGKYSIHGSSGIITKVSFKANFRRGQCPAGGRQTRGRPEHGAGGAPRSAGDRRQARVPSGRSRFFNAGNRWNRAKIVENVDFLTEKLGNHGFVYRKIRKSRIF